MKTKFLIPILALALCVGLFTGVTGCRNLDPAGVYHGDTLLADADQAINDSYDIVELFVSTEFQNRAVVPLAVTQAADAVRANYPKALRGAFAARKAYVANPTDGTAISGLKTATSILKAVLAQAQQFTPQAAKGK